MNWFQRLFGNTYDWVGVRTTEQVKSVPVMDTARPHEIRFIDPRILLKPDEIPTELLYWTPEQVGEWMRREFRYATDLTQYGVKDQWGSPSELVEKKVADCEGWATFFTCFLLRAGYKARTCCGMQIGVGGYHAWTLCDRRETMYLFDPLLQLTGWQKAQWTSGYIPDYSFDQTYFYRHRGDPISV